MNVITKDKQRPAFSHRMSGLERALNQWHLTQLSLWRKFRAEKYRSQMRPLFSHTQARTLHCFLSPVHDNLLLSVADQGEPFWGCISSGLFATRTETRTKLGGCFNMESHPGMNVVKGNFSSSTLIWLHSNWK